MRKRKNKKGMQLVLCVGAACLLLGTTFFAEQLDAKFSKVEEPVIAVVDEAVSVVESGRTEWQYRDDNQPPADNESGIVWTAPNYEATDWKTGLGSFGSYKGQRTDRVNDRNPANLPNHYTTEGLAIPVYYFRTEFTMDTLFPGWQMRGKIRFDDAVIIRLNGMVLYTANVPEMGYEGTDGYGAANSVDTSLTETFALADTSALRKGKNILTVELHQVSKKSTDLYFDFIYLEYTPATSAAETNLSGNAIVEPGITNTSLRVNWLTTEKASYMLEFTNQKDYTETSAMKNIVMEQHISQEPEAYCYTAAINGLQPNSTYRYRVVSADGTASSKMLSFRTHSPDAPVSFVFAGDPQIGARHPKTDLAGWASTLDAVSSIDPDPVFLACAGDLIDSSDPEEALEQTFLFRSPQLLTQLPILPVPGNHDGSLFRTQYRRTNDNEEGNDHFVRGNALFVRLNTNNKSHDKQLAYLENAIQNNPSQWVIVFMHYSMFSTGPHSGDAAIAALRDRYASEFSRLNVDLVMSGHDHLYSRTHLMQGETSTGKRDGERLPGETMYLTANSASGSKYYNSNLQNFDYLAVQRSAQEPYLTHVEIVENELRLRTYRVSDRQEVDACILTKQPATLGVSGVSAVPAA